MRWWSECERKKTELSWVSMTLSQSSGFSFKIPPLSDTLPALLTRMSMAPSSRSTWLQRRLQCGALGHINRHRKRWNADGLQFRKHSLILLAVTS